MESVRLEGIAKESYLASLTILGVTLPLTSKPQSYKLEGETCWVVEVNKRIFTWKQ